jgi:heme-degrading monooxygenase HmoA
MIEHTVTFALKHPRGSPAEGEFLRAAADLARIPGVQDFAIRRQVSLKLDHDYGITMRFRSQADYDAYSQHPMHTAFVQERWLKEVVRFQESDFTPLNLH